MKVSNLSKIPFFSVVLCTFNRAYILERAIKSLINQNFKDFELIIIDDGSSDDTFQVVNKFKNELNLKYIYQNNSGISISRNIGIVNAIGEYVTFLDSDDEYLPNHLESRYDILQENKFDFLHGGFQIIGNEFVPDMNDISKLISIYDCVVGGTFFIKRNQALQFGGFERFEYGDDNYFFQKITKLSKNYSHTNIPSYIYYRDLNDSICNTINSVCL